MKLEFKQWFIPNIGVVPVDPETPLVLEVEKDWVNLTNAEIDEHMNERIKELAEQTGFFNIFVEPQIYEFTPEKMEKFAELIVNECADWINDNVGMIDEEARQDLLKHFGANNE